MGHARTCEDYIRGIFRRDASGSIGEAERREMASVLRSALRGVREKGIGGFLRELKEEGFL